MLLHRCAARMTKRGVVVAFEAWLTSVRRVLPLSSILLKAQARELRQALTKWLLFQRDQLVRTVLARKAQRGQWAAEMTIEDLLQRTMESEVVLQERKAAGERRESQLHARVLSLEDELIRVRHKANNGACGRGLGFFELEIAHLADLVRTGESEVRTLRSIIVTLEKEKLDLTKELEESQEKAMRARTRPGGPTSWVDVYCNAAMSPSQKPSAAGVRPSPPNSPLLTEELSKVPAPEHGTKDRLPTYVGDWLSNPASSTGAAPVLCACTLSCICMCLGMCMRGCMRE